jgi:hypothetical protein
VPTLRLDELHVVGWALPTFFFDYPNIFWIFSVFFGFFLKNRQSWDFSESPKLPTPFPQLPAEISPADPQISHRFTPVFPRLYTTRR